MLSRILLNFPDHLFSHSSPSSSMPSFFSHLKHPNGKTFPIGSWWPYFPPHWGNQSNQERISIDPLSAKTSTHKLSPSYVGTNELLLPLTITKPFIFALVFLVSLLYHQSFPLYWIIPISIQKSPLDPPNPITYRCPCLWSPLQQNLLKLFSIFFAYSSPHPNCLLSPSYQPFCPINPLKLLWLISHMTSMLLNLVVNSQFSSYFIHLITLFSLIHFLHHFQRLYSSSVSS